jgi:uncharacterized protein YdhG (YjbR/CyaY superfamily)
MAEHFASVDEYLDSLPVEPRDVLLTLRRTIHDVVPGATETISYNIPTIVVDGRPLLYFAGWKQHLGVYPVPCTDNPIEAEIEPYRATKDSLNFPYSKPIPYDLVGRIAAMLLARREEAGR